MEQFDEYITCNRDNLTTQTTGIFYGGQRSIKQGSIQIDNRKTGEKATVEFVEKLEGE